MEGLDVNEIPPKQLAARQDKGNMDLFGRVRV